MATINMASLIGWAAGMRNRGVRKADASAFMGSFEEFLATGHAHPDHYRQMLNAFIYSGGELLSSANARLKKDAVRQGVAPSTESPLSREDVSHLESLELNGFTVLKGVVESDAADEYLERVRTVECSLVSDRANVSGQVRRPDLLNPLAEKYLVPVSYLARDSLVTDLVSSARLKAIAAAYLGVTPLLDTVSSWLSFPSLTPSSQAGQIFHFDLERIKWLKFFVFLTDTSLDNGAHVFVPGTHRDNGIPSGILNRGYTRHSDDRIAALMNREPITIEANVGDVLVEDTRGLHKGLRLKKGYRAVIELQYATCLFGGPSSWSQHNPDGSNDHI